ncbi:hypothetical protein B0H17DRAFT_378945 [Mycena rosella]|uniref:Uncharacterized protein n=1 Tax=Mycena rosella TaxID=1033263 RepID=A0AAD7CNM8_MYCRO|nr:hypothetical protein B0H17DRAFT_378945 [Mycena rosella]
MIRVVPLTPCQPNWNDLGLRFDFSTSKPFTLRLPKRGWIKWTHLRHDTPTPHLFPFPPNMTLEKLSKSDMEALLAFHVDAARHLEERLRSTFPLPENGSGIVLSPEDQLDTEGPSPNSGDSSRLHSHFEMDLHRRSLAPSLSPSPPSTPVRPARLSPPPVREAWPVWGADPTSPISAPRHSASFGRKRRRIDEDEPRAREGIHLDPGWPRGLIRTPPRRRRIWDKENERRS